jgi:hypothetical protein
MAHSIKTHPAIYGHEPINSVSYQQFPEAMTNPPDEGFIATLNVSAEMLALLLAAFAIIAAAVYVMMNLVLAIESTVRATMAF